MTKLRDSQVLQAIPTNGTMSPAERFERLEQKVDKIWDKMAMFEVKLAVISAVISAAIFFACNYITKHI
jgi:hypothetical protein